MFNRRQFTTLAGASLGSLLTQKLRPEQARMTHSPDKFYFALVADTHIIDDFYVKGSENGVEDNESILVPTPRFTLWKWSPIRKTCSIAGCRLLMRSRAEVFRHTTRLDNAKAISDQFNMPVHLGFGNHDYDVHRISRKYEPSAV